MLVQVARREVPTEGAEFHAYPAVHVTLNVESRVTGSGTLKLYLTKSSVLVEQSTIDMHILGFDANGSKMVQVLFCHQVLTTIQFPY